MPSARSFQSERTVQEVDRSCESLLLTAQGRAPVDDYVYVDDDGAVGTCDATRDANDSADAPPPDKLYATFFVLLMLGALSIPFCALTASPHFLANYYSCFHIKSLQYTAFWNNAAAIVSCVYFVVNVPAQLIAMRTGTNVPLFAASFVGVAVGIAVIPLFPIAFPHSSEVTAVTVLIAVTTWCSVWGGLAQSMSFSIASKFGSAYAPAVPIGIGFSGFVSALLRFVFALALPNPTPEDTLLEAYVFFALDVVATLVAAFATFPFLRNVRFARFHYFGEDTSVLGAKAVAAPPAGVAVTMATATATSTEPQGAVGVLWLILDLFIINALVMVGTYSMYPGVAARDVDNGRLWGVIVFMAFNAGSLVGRALSLKCGVPADATRVRKMLVIVTFLRLFPIACPSLAGLYVPGSLGNGHVAATIVQLFSGLTNGLSAYAYRVVSAVSEPSDRATAARVMTVAMSSGLAIGGVIGLALCASAS